MNRVCRRFSQLEHETGTLNCVYGYSHAQSGDELGGYRLIRPLGHGGSGVVWEAEDEGGNSFALKLLHPAIAADPVSRQRLAREASTLNRIRNDGVAQVVDLETEGDVPFVVTELIDGLSLRDDLKENGPLPFADARYILETMRETLDAVHERGVIHRDLKPSNIVLGPLGPVLIDFGIAQAEDDDRLTSTGLVSGTAGWVAPEVLGGKDPDRASDWWSLIAVFLTMLTARQPFGSGGAEAVLSRVWMGHPDTDGLHPELADLIRQALAPVDQRLAFPDFAQRLRSLDADTIENWSEDDNTRMLETATAAEMMTPAHEGGDDETVHLPGTSDSSVERCSVFDREDELDRTSVHPVVPDSDIRPGDERDDIDRTSTYLVASPTWASMQPDSAIPQPPAEPLFPEPYRYAKPPSAVVLSLGIATALAFLPLHLGSIGAVVVLVVLLIAETAGYARVWRERRRIATGVSRSSDNILASMRSLIYVFQAALALLLNVSIALVIVVAAWILWGMNNGDFDWTHNLYFAMLRADPGQPLVALGASQLVIAAALWVSNLFIILVTRIGPGGWHLREGAYSIGSTLVPNAVARPAIGAITIVLVLLGFVFSFTA